MGRRPMERIGATSTCDVKHHAFLAPIDFVRLERKELPVPALVDGASSKVAGFLASEHKSVRREDVYGRAFACTRMLRCLEREPVDGWNFAGGPSALSTILAV